jgi:hypothetical protein
MKSAKLKLVKQTDLRTVEGRKPNDALSDPKGPSFGAALLFCRARRTAISCAYPSVLARTLPGPAAPPGASCSSLSASA